MTSRGDLHVHSIHSTDSGNYALRRARLGESFTDPGRVYEVSLSRGMTFVTISDHNTVAGALRIAERPGAFVSVEVTTRFPEDDLPLHVLVWNLTEEDHRDLQPLRASVYELVAFLHGRGLRHALAHPLYRMGPPITPSHIERMMLLFGVWEGRNGARPEEQNELACRLAAACTPAYLEKLAERHGLAPWHRGPIALTGGSDDHAALDIATTWTEAPGETVDEFLAAVCAGEGAARGGHGSTVKLAHAVAGLFLNAYRAGGGRLPELWGERLQALFDEDAEDAGERHAEISAFASLAARRLAEQVRAGGVGVDAIPGLGQRLGTLLLAGALQAPYLATAQHHAGSRAGLRQLEHAFFGLPARVTEPRALVFTDTYAETNGVAGTMRRIAAMAVQDGRPVRVVISSTGPAEEPGTLALPPDWSVQLPGYELVELRFPHLTELLARVEAERPEVIHVATPGPVGACGLLVGRLLGLPVIGSYHTELGPYTLHLTRDLLVAELMGSYVDWFYRQCDLVLAPTRAVAAALGERGLAGRIGVWGRGVDTEQFTPELRSERLRSELLDGGDVLLLAVGRVSREKRLDVALEAFRRLREELPGARLAIAGDGPARDELAASAPPGVRFLGELRGRALAELYASADVFCFASTTDTFGQVLIEAAASGLPVVAADTGGAPELVRHGETGLLVPPDDVAGLARALARLAASRTERERLGAAGRRDSLARSWKSSFHELRSAYGSVVAGPGDGAGGTPRTRPPRRLVA